LGVIELVYLCVLLGCFSPFEGKTIQNKKEQVLSWIEEENVSVCERNDFEMVARHHHFFLSKSGKGENPSTAVGERLTHSLISRVKAMIQSQ